MTSFMDDVLVKWVRTVWSRDELSYSDLSDGVFLLDAFREIDPKSSSDGIISNVEDVKDRLQNWDILWKNIADFYSDVLQELIVMAPPNLIAISREPDSERAHEEVGKALLLVLGAAVQCERKEDFIEAIRIHLTDSEQSRIMDYIQTVHPGHGSRLVIHKQSAKALHLREGETLEQRYNSLISILASVIHHRDCYVDDVKDVLHQVEVLSHQLSNLRAQVSGSADRSANPAGQEKHHLGVELAEAKAKMRKMRSELEEKGEQLLEYREELDEQKRAMSKLQESHRQLTAEARNARSYRDEVDVLREKAARVDRLEVEVNKCKNLLGELDFNRSLVQELREDKQLLEQNTVMLEEKLQAAQKRVDRACDLEADVQRYKEKLDSLSEEREEMFQRIDCLVDENNRLLHEHRSTLHESASLEEELARTRAQGVGASGKALSDQLHESATSKLKRLELDNSRLQHELTELRQNCQLENSARILELEKENHRLSKKVEKLQQSSSGEVQAAVTLQEEVRQLGREKQQLMSTMETVKENCDRQIQELERENETLTETLQVLRSRCEKTSDSRVNELERDNSRLQQTVNDLSSRLSRQDFELKAQRKAGGRLQEASARLAELEAENERLGRQNGDWQREVHLLKATADRAEEQERQIDGLEVENAKLVKTLANHKKALQHKDRVEQENLALQAEAARLQRTIEAFKTASTRVADLEGEREELRGTVARLEKAMAAGGEERRRLEQLEVRHMEMEAQNQKLQRHLDAAGERARALEEELTATDSENEGLQKSLEALKMQMKALEELEKENGRLERENVSLGREKASLDKETKRLRGNVEAKEKALDEATRRCAQLEKDNRQLSTREEAARDTSERVRELERENFELVQQMAVDKKALSDLREELVDEKIKRQRLANDVEQTNHELEKIGLNRQQLQQAQDAGADTETKYRALEAAMEETARRSLEIKEQKILAVTARLEESRSRNQRLQEDLQRSRSEHEALKQRYEEEFSVLSGTRRSAAGSSESLAGGSAKKLLDLQDHLVSLERRNATLEAENGALKAQVASLEERQTEVDNRQSGLQSDLQAAQKQNGDLLAFNAKLQVENSTLQSQSASMMAQNAQLQVSLNEMEAEAGQLSSQLEELQATHASLVHDHEQLQKLHEQLTNEYETLLGELSALKSSQKSLRSDMKVKEERLQELVREKDSVKHLREALEKEKDSLNDSTTRNYVALRTDLSHLRDERDRLVGLKEQFEEEHRALLRDFRNAKQACSDWEAKCAQQRSELEEYRNQLNQQDVELAKMVDKYEILNQQNMKLEEEKKALMMQLQHLMNQNQNLLTQTLENTEHHFEEEISLRDQLANLKRQKEKLEEKIMDQYKRYPSPKKHRSLGEKIVRRAKDMLAKRKSATEIKGRLEGGESTEDVALRKRSQSMYNVFANGSLEEEEEAVPQRKFAAAKSTDDIFKLDGSNENPGSGPVPRLRFSQTPPPSKLVPGSMSIYDRSPDSSPRGNLLSLREFLNDLDKQRPPDSKPIKSGQLRGLRGRRLNSVGNLKEAEDDVDAGFGQEWGSRTSRNVTPTPRRQLPATPPKVSASGPSPSPSSAASRCRSVPVDRQMRALFAASPPPTPPSRNTSLPVTERTEKQFSSSSGGPSPAPSGNSSGPSSGTRQGPLASTSTKVILSRMVAQVNQPLSHTMPRPGTAMGLPSRPYTPQDAVLRSRTPAPDRPARPATSMGDTMPQGRRSVLRSPPPPAPPARAESTPRRTSAPSIRHQPAPPRRDASLGPPPPSQTPGSADVPPPPPPRAESSAGGGTNGSAKPQLWYQYGCV